MQFAAGELVLDGLHDQALTLKQGQTVKGIADDHGLEMTAIARDLNFRIRDACTDQLCDCFGFQDKPPLLSEML